MNPRSIVVQESARQPEQLILLFHGVGATPEGLIPLGQRLASAFPNGAVVSVAAHRLRDLGGDVTADILPFAGHEINAEMGELVVERLLGHVPKRMWEEALRAEKTVPRSR